MNKEILDKIHYYIDNKTDSNFCIRGFEQVNRYYSDLDTLTKMFKKEFLEIFERVNFDNSFFIKYKNELKKYGIEIINESNSVNNVKEKYSIITGNFLVVNATSGVIVGKDTSNIQINHKESEEENKTLLGKFINIINMIADNITASFVNCSLVKIFNKSKVNFINVSSATLIDSYAYIDVEKLKDNIQFEYLLLGKSKLKLKGILMHQILIEIHDESILDTTELIDNNNLVKIALFK